VGGRVTETGPGPLAPKPPEDDAGGSGTVQPDPRPRNRTARFAWTATVVILVAVVALMIYALSGSPSTPQVVHRTITSSDVVSTLAGVPPAVSDSIGVSSPRTPLVPPTVLTGQPSLRSGGKPEVLYVGAEFCSFCGSERWALIVALSRFGHFTDLRDMQSAPSSVFPGIQTFSFVGTTYASRYITFAGVELFSDVANANGVFTRIAKLTPAQSAVVNRYGIAPPGGPSAGVLPFVDINNQMVTSTSGFSPAVIERQSQVAIAGELSQPDTATGQAIVASANYLTAGICAATGQQPASICTSKGVRAAAEALGLG
jgi:hypothetical protein